MVDGLKRVEYDVVEAGADFAGEPYGLGGQPGDFGDVWTDLLRPALTAAGGTLTQQVLSKPEVQQVLTQQGEQIAAQKTGEQAYQLYQQAKATLAKNQKLILYGAVGAVALTGAFFLYRSGRKRR